MIGVTQREPVSSPCILVPSLGHEIMNWTVRAEEARRIRCTLGLPSFTDSGWLIILSPTDPKAVLLIYLGVDCRNG